MSCRDLFLALGKDPQTDCTDGTSIRLSSLPRSRSLQDLSSEVRPSDEADGDGEGHETYFEMHSPVKFARKPVPPPLQVPRPRSIEKGEQLPLQVQIPPPATYLSDDSTHNTRWSYSSDGGSGADSPSKKIPSPGRRPPLSDGRSGADSPLDKTRFSRRRPPSASEGGVTPGTASMLQSMRCELLSPCLSIQSDTRALVARPAAIFEVDDVDCSEESTEGIWIRLELQHSLQTLVDACGNGKISWFYVAVRLDLANALDVNPKHLQIISLEQRPDAGSVVLQVYLSQSPDSALSLVNVGGMLHSQAEQLETQAREHHSLLQTLSKSTDQDALQDTSSGTRPTAAADVESLASPPTLASVASDCSLAETVTEGGDSAAAGLRRGQKKLTIMTRTPSMLREFSVTKFGRSSSLETSPTKRSTANENKFGRARQRVWGPKLKRHESVVSFLQLVETVEVHDTAPAARSAPLSRRLWLYVAAALCFFASSAYLASAFGMLSMPLRAASHDAGASLRTVGGGTAGLPSHSSFRGGAGAQGGATQLQMLEPMTLATVVLAGASKFKGFPNRAPGSNAKSANKDSGDKNEAMVRKTCDRKGSRAPVQSSVVQQGETMTRRQRLQMRRETSMTDSLGFLPPLLKVDQDTLKDVPRTVTSARHKAPIYLSEKLEDDVSVERVAVEELVESMLDSVDQLAGKTTTIVQHAATHKHAIHSAASMTDHAAHHAAARLHDSLTVLQHAEVVGHAISHLGPGHTDMFSKIGGIASAGLAVGLSIAATRELTSTLSRESDTDA